MFISETVQIKTTRNLLTNFLPCWFRNLPEFFVSNIVSDDVPVADFTIGLIPHHVQLGGGDCTHPDVVRSSLWSLPVSYELQDVSVSIRLTEISATALTEWLRHASRTFRKIYFIPSETEVQTLCWTTIVISHFRKLGWTSGVCWRMFVIN